MWYVGYLLINEEDIHKTLDIESDEYNDLMAVKEALKDVSFKDNQLVNFNLYLSGVIKKSTCNAFNNVCEQIAEILGGVFTDEGYVQYMTDKYNLSTEQTHKLKEFMLSTYKYKLMRTIRGA